MKILVDVNLSPKWVPLIRDRGWQAVHWSEIGASRAPDQEIFEWARKHEYVVFTNDLGFGTLLALARSNGPSVLQIRAKGVRFRLLQDLVTAALEQYEQQLTQGALVVVELTQNRVRVLPI